MSRVWGGILTVTAIVACPCHLPLALPLLLGVLGGPGAGSFIAANAGLVYGLATGYFILALGGGLFLLGRRRRHRHWASTLAKGCPVPVEESSMKGPD